MLMVTWWAVSSVYCAARVSMARGDVEVMVLARASTQESTEGSSTREDDLDPLVIHIC